MLDPARALMKGIPTKIADAVNATGNNQSRPFSIVRPPSESQSKITLQAVGAFTILNGNVEYSLNGGANWSVFQAFDIVAGVVSILAGIGTLYRLTFNNVTQTTPPDIFAVLG